MSDPSNVSAAKKKNKKRKKKSKSQQGEASPETASNSGQPAPKVTNVHSRLML